ncbi:MAG: glycine cleavage system aminomethyltransferase GcvT [Patescibacteria group bacterium]|jgi:aminomethyltransferase
MLKKTSLNAKHHTLGARMVDFGGWEMPVMYTNQIQEHQAVRQRAGLFDVSHMGEFIITGSDAVTLLQKVTSRDISKMTNQQVALGVICNEQGGIIDDITIYKYSDQKYMLVVNAGTTPGDYDWIKKQAVGLTVQVDNISDTMTKLDTQGPQAETILQKLTAADLKLIKRYNFIDTAIAGIPMTISRSGYTGEDGFELYFTNTAAEQIWDKLLAIGQDYGLLPCGLGARDTLRTECGMMLYGHDIDINHTPLEAVYGWAVSFTKDFIGKAALEQQKQAGLTRKLVGFEMLDRGIARDGYLIYYNGETVGAVTSGVPSPTLGKNIGLGYVKYGLHKLDTIIQIQIRTKLVAAKIVKLPFYKKS